MTRWTPAMLAKLRRLIERGKTDAQAAADLGVTIYAVKYARKVRLKHRRAPRLSGIDDELRRILSTEGRQSDVEIARRFGVCRETVRRRREALGISYNRAWTTTEIKLLRRMFNAGKPDRAFIEQYVERWPDRTPPTISQVRERRYRLGLSRRMSIQTYSTKTLIDELHRRGASTERLGSLTVAQLVAELEKRGRAVTVSTGKRRRSK